MWWQRSPGWPPRLDALILPGSVPCEPTLHRQGVLHLTFFLGIWFISSSAAEAPLSEHLDECVTGSPSSRVE